MRPLVLESKYGAMILLHRAKSDSADTDLRDRVERQLDWEPQITSTDIGVATEDGVVTLTGFVNTYPEKLAAERVTLKTYGVSAVANEIQVKPLFKKTDTDIASAALNALKEQVDVPDEKIKLSVKDGWITLEGNVDWFYQKSGAEFAVKHLTGVRGVTNSINVKPQVSTIEVKDKIEDALKRNAEVDARRISVEAFDGKVTLRGNVRSWFEKDEAASAAWAAPGVTEVTNQIVVVP
ncbi:MAG TPA: BON domain-containing protein [Pyrinomonadaceae bacterium]|nr:BON domain-containing protein [Pyrinomonadaceae bacterium]